MNSNQITAVIKNILAKKNLDIYKATNRDKYNERLQAILDAKYTLNSKKKGLTIEDIIQHTPKNTKDKSKIVGVQLFKKIITPRYKHYFFKAKTKLPNKFTRLVEILLKGTPKQDTKSSKAYVSCSCEDFLFTCEVALKEKDASQIIYSNGEKPKVKNPKMIPCACKHIVASYKYLKKYNFGEDKRNAENQLKKLIENGKAEVIKKNGKIYYKFM